MPQSKITVKEKPDDLPWDDIHKLLWAAHEKNRKKGVFMRNPTLSGEELEKHVGKNGKCFVAFDGERLVGMCAYKIVNRKRWYARDKKVVYYMLSSVHPDYQGSSVFFKLIKFRQQYVDALHVDIIDMDTDENNSVMQKIMLKQGFKYADYVSHRSPNYSVVMVKWPNGCPYSDWHLRVRFKFGEMKTKLRFKKGRIKRFGI